MSPLVGKAKQYFASRPLTASGFLVSTSLTISANIKRLRLARGLSQTDLAKRLNTSQSTIALWESPHYLGYSLLGLSRVAFALGVDVSDLLNKSESLT